MKPALQLRINQQLALTPQLQQAIRLLQLSSVELEMELREALESNPLLELAETEGGDGEAEAQADGDTVVDIAGDGESANAEREEPNYDEPMDFELERTDYGAPMPEDAEGFEAQDGEPEDLRDHLLWQLNLTSMSARDRAIGVTIIEAIDDDGYLHESDETLQSNLAGLYRVGADEIEAVRHRIRQLIAAETAGGVLSDDKIVEQLKQDGIDIARRTVAKYREALRIPSSVQRRREKQMAARLGN